MKNKLQRPITDENFNEAWDYVNGKLVEIQKKKAIRKVLAFFGNILFFICICVMSYGALYHIIYPSFWSYLASLKGFYGLWSIVMPLVNHPNLPWFVQVVIYLIPAFVISILGCGLVALILWFVLPSNAKRVATGDKAKDSKELVRMVKEVDIRSKKVESIDSMLGMLGYMVFVIAIVVGYISFIIQNEDYEVVKLVIGWFMEAQAILPNLFQILPNMIGFAILMLAVFYGLLNVLFSNLLKPIYKTNLPEEIIYDTENYYYECNPEEKARIQEEEKILERAKEITLARKREKDELLAQINYKNPIYKYIKMGITIVVMIIVLVIGTNYIKSIDLQGLLSSWGVESTENTEN